MGDSSKSSDNDSSNSLVHTSTTNAVGAIEETTEEITMHLRFPDQLMQVIENPIYKDVIWWGPHGDTFWILPFRLQESVIKKYFGGTKFESFRRKLHRWGFRRVKDESFPSREIMVYRNPLFQRGKPDLLKKLRIVSRDERIAKEQDDWQKILAEKLKESSDSDRKPSPPPPPQPSLMDLQSETASESNPRGSTLSSSSVPDANLMDSMAASHRRLSNNPMHETKANPQSTTAEQLAALMTSSTTATSSSSSTLFPLPAVWNALNNNTSTNATSSLSSSQFTTQLSLDDIITTYDHLQQRQRQSLLLLATEQRIRLLRQQIFSPSSSLSTSSLLDTAVTCALRDSLLSQGLVTNNNNDNSSSINNSIPSLHNAISGGRIDTTVPYPPLMGSNAVSNEGSTVSSTTTMTSSLPVDGLEHILLRILLAHQGQQQQQDPPHHSSNTTFNAPSNHERRMG